MCPPPGLQASEVGTTLRRLHVVHDEVPMHSVAFAADVCYAYMSSHQLVTLSRRSQGALTKRCVGGYRPGSTNADGPLVGSSLD
jgi:hypothetical protein